MPLGITAAALHARFVSRLKEERATACQVLDTAAAATASGGGGGGASSSSWLGALLGLQPDLAAEQHRAELVKRLEDAMYCAKLCAYAQGLALLAQAAKEHGWACDLAATVRCWRGGSIIRANLLDPIESALVAPASPPASSETAPQQPAPLANVLLHPDVASLVAPRVQGLRQVVALCAMQGVPAPALSQALAYYDSYRTPRLLSASLMQAQRDGFGGHTYKRVDMDGTFHSKWGSKEDKE